eukprot:CAMPEP_0204834508 /NCGR_PEP_ID=MMETSP1346-20131115/20025_1 /ASSEMBLY_ACC=CAM_ASM_000771 /TAXON_ID=215587 /ORGANISM="Aplanochytrium stocchinoi, Strain GSBS06" /LENGTH=327 /DNA_ID=CAMNT_0051967867 /DNA_START=775 /DNA_END=1758 /DNA_ORIENTATION=+
MSQGNCKPSVSKRGRPQAESSLTCTVTRPAKTAKKSQTTQLQPEQRLLLGSINRLRPYPVGRSYSVGKTPPRDMKRLSPDTWYIVTKVANWGDAPALFLVSEEEKSKDEKSKAEFFKPPKAYWTARFHVGDKVKLSKVGYSASRNLVAIEIEVEPTKNAPSESEGNDMFSAPNSPVIGTAGLKKEAYNVANRYSIAAQPIPEMNPDFVKLEQHGQYVFDPRSYSFPSNITSTNTGGYSLNQSGNSAPPLSLLGGITYPNLSQNPQLPYSANHIHHLLYQYRGVSPPSIHADNVEHLQTTTGTLPALMPRNNSFGGNFDSFPDERKKM